MLWLRRKVPTTCPGLVAAVVAVVVVLHVVLHVVVTWMAARKSLVRRLMAEPASLLPLRCCLSCRGTFDTIRHLVKTPPPPPRWLRTGKKVTVVVTLSTLLPLLLPLHRC